MMNLRMTQESVRVDERFYLPICRREKAAGRFQHRRVIVEQPDRGSRFSHQSLTKPGAHRRRRSSGIVSCRAFLVRSLRGIIPPASATSTPLAINRSAASAGFFPYKPVSFFFQAEDGIRGLYVTGVQTCALPI